MPACTSNIWKHLSIPLLHKVHTILGTYQSSLPHLITCVIFCPLENNCVISHTLSSTHSVCNFINKFVVTISTKVFFSICTMCHTGVVYDNVSVVFMHWAFSINNKVGLVSFANIYWKTSICFDLQKMVIQSDLNLELGPLHQKNNTLITIKYII